MRLCIGAHSEAISPLPQMENAIMAENNVNAPVPSALSVAILEAFYGGITQDEKEAQAALQEKTKARLPALYEAFKNTSEVDFKLVIAQWKDAHKGDRTIAVRTSEATVLFFAHRRINGEYANEGYHNAVKMAREALKKAGYRSNGDKELSKDQQEFNKLKNAKSKARKELEKELGDRFHTMDEIELAKLVKARVEDILNPNTLPLEERAKAEVIEHGPAYALQHIEALALALGVEVKHENGVITFAIDESILEEEKPEEEKKAA